MQSSPAGCPGPVEETIGGWGQYSHQIPSGQQKIIDELADLIVSSFAQSNCPPFRSVLFVGHADKDWHGAAFEEEVSKERARTVQKALTNKVRKLWADRRMGPPPAGGVAWEERGEGSKHMIAPPYHSANRRVVVTLTRSGAPVKPVTETKVVEVTAKSFIALIGSRTGSIPGMTLILPPPPAPPVPVPVSRQFLLETMAKTVDAMMKEDPKSTAKDKVYRLFSSCRFTVVFENKKILAATPSELDTDTGKEGPLQAPPLVTTPIKVSATGAESVTFSWFGSGRPHPAAEPGFQQVHPRTSVFIWHQVSGTFDVSTGSLVTTVSIRGSQFPSHRVFVDATLAGDVVQGEFSNLWVADPADSTRVK
jgi:hypothetical protein